MLIPALLTSKMSFCQGDVVGNGRQGLPNGFRLPGYHHTKLVVGDR